jgi:large subunit ribosomal protein L29
MRAKEFREMADEELAAKLGELREAQFHLRLRRGTNRLESPSQMKKNRRDVARALTVQRERVSGVRR